LIKYIFKAIVQAGVTSEWEPIFHPFEGQARFRFREREPKATSAVPSLNQGPSNTDGKAISRG
jgi:hypothetical protein